MLFSGTCSPIMFVAKTMMKIERATSMEAILAAKMASILVALSIFQDQLMPADEKEEEINKLVRYWMRHRGTHAWYAIRFLLCEFLNLVVVVMQVK